MRNICDGFHRDYARYLVSADADGAIQVWFLDWSLHEAQLKEWVDSLRPYVENFLTVHRPYASEISDDGEFTADDVSKALTKRGKPEWTEKDVAWLVYSLGCAGFGYVSPSILKPELHVTASRMGRRSIFGLGRE